MELVSVIITTHNRDWDLSRAIKSVLNQSYSNIEIYVIDDNPSSATEGIINQFTSNINYIKSKKKGLPFSRNLGLSLSKGDFVVFLDDDDELLNDSIAKRKLVFDQLNEKIKSKTALIYSGCSINLVRENRVTFNMPKIYGDVSNYLKLGHISTIPSTFFLNKSVLIKYEIKFDESFSSFIDHDFFMSLAYNKLHVYYVNEALTKTYIFPTKKSMVNDINERKRNIKNFLKKWNNYISDYMNIKVKKNFYRNYIGNEYSKLIFNSFLSLDILTAINTYNDLKYFENKTQNLSLHVIKKFVLKLIRHFTPSFILRFKK